MNDNQLKIVRAMRWVFYPMAALMLAAFIWDVAGGSGGARLAGLSGAMDVIGDPFLLAVTALFWVVFIALFVEFVRREAAGAAVRSDLGERLLEVRQPTAVIRLVLPLVAAVFVAGLNLLVFAPGVLDLDFGQTDFAERLLFWLFYAIGHFMFVVLMLRAFRHRPFFVATGRGFLYEPGDLSAGLVLWSDVAGIREADLLQGGGSSSGPGLSRTLVVALKDPAAYVDRYNPLLRLLYNLLIRVVRYQAGGDGDIVVVAADFGRRYPEVRELMARKVSEAGGAVSLA